MRKLIHLLFVALFTCTFNQLATAQEASNISIGAGAVYGFEIEEIGIQTGGTYTLNKNMRLGADFIYWLTNTKFIDFKALEINGNIHYIFYNGNDLQLYGLGSLGFHGAKYSYKTEHKTDSALGLGVGAGLEYSIGSLKLYAEPRLFLSGLDQLAISVGLRLPI